MAGWWYNHITGTIKEIPVTAHNELLSPGWHGPFDAKLSAETFLATHKAANPSWRDPDDGDSSILDEARDKAGEIVEGAKDVIENLNPFNIVESLNPFRGINLQVWIIRIGEIVLGTVLIAVAVAKLTGADNAIKGLAEKAIGAAGMAATGGTGAIVKGAGKVAGAAKAAKG